MKVNINKFHSILNDYLVQVIVPKLPNNYLKFGLAFTANYLSNSLVINEINKYKDLIEKFGIISNDTLDLDLFRDNALKALRLCNGNFEIYGYKVDEDDINSLYNIAKNYADTLPLQNITNESFRNS